MPERLALYLDGKLAIVQPPEAKKPFLVRLRQHRQDLRGVMQSANYSSDTEIPVAADEILSVFPHKLPTFGRVYNVSVEPKLRAEKLPRWGKVTYFRQLANAERQNLHRGLDLTYRRFVRRNKLNFLLPINLEIRNPKGKQVGMYHSTKGEREQFIEISPVSFITNPQEPNDKRGGAKYIQRIAMHELGHPFWQLYLNNAMKARWIKLYSAFSKVYSLRADDMERIRQDLIGSKITINQYRKAAEDETRLFLDTILLWIKKIHRLNTKFLDLLLLQGSDLTDYWPRSKLHLSEVKIPVTKYAGKNPEEFCCESLTFFGFGEKLPTAIRRLVVRSIRSVQPR